jgi:hypothetical protein
MIQYLESSSANTSNTKLHMVAFLVQTSVRFVFNLHGDPKDLYAIPAVVQHAVCSIRGAEVNVEVTVYR